MEDLRNEGYELEAVRRLGYRIASKPDKVTANEIQLGLQTKHIGRTVYFEESVESTQHIAKQSLLMKVQKKEQLLWQKNKQRVEVV